jgi:hypothetical protein
MALILKNMVILGMASAGAGIAQELDNDVARKAALARFAVKVVPVEHIR